MKILHISDLEGDVDALKSVVEFARKSDDLEVVVCSGDLAGKCLPDQDVARMNSYFQYIVENSGIQGPVAVNDLIRDLKRMNLPGTLGDAVEGYTELEREFDQDSERHYEEIGGFLGKFPQTVLTVPGNWDSKKYFECLGRFDIHTKTREVGDVDFGGFGTANSLVNCVPLTRAIGFSEKEMYEFLESECPEIAVTHMPPIGIKDRTYDGRHVGSKALRKYLSEDPQKSNLVLCGHVHEDAGSIQLPNETIVINPGNLGGRESRTKGCFAVIDYQPERIEVFPYRVRNGGEVVRVAIRPVEPVTSSSTSSA